VLVVNFHAEFTSNLQEVGPFAKEVADEPSGHVALTERAELTIQIIIGHLSFLRLALPVYH